MTYPFTGQVYTSPPQREAAAEGEGVGVGVGVVTAGDALGRGVGVGVGFTVGGTVGAGDGESVTVAGPFTGASAGRTNSLIRYQPDTPMAATHRKRTM